MLALGIDTSTPMVSVVLADAGQVLARRDESANNAQGEVLAGLVAAVLRDAGSTAADLSALGIGLGPGPFTGLRVGIVTAAALSDALGIPAYGECSLDVIDRPEGRPCAVVTDARRRQVYWAAYDEHGARFQGPDIAPPADVAEHLRGRVAALAGPGATQYRDVFADFDVTATQWPDAGRLATLALRRLAAGGPVEPLTPLYLRRPDAREPGPPKRVMPA